MPRPSDLLAVLAPRGRAHGAQLWRVVALVAVVAAAAWSYLAGAFGTGEGSLAATARQTPGLFMPDAYAFWVWPLVYVGLFAYTVASLRASAKDLALKDEIAPSVTRLNLLAIVWVVSFQLELTVVSLLSGVLLFGLTLALHGKISRRMDEGEALAPWRVPFALLLGWMLVATIINLQVALWRAGSVLPIEPVWVIAMLALVSGVALLIGRRDRDPIVPLVVSWAVVAIAAADRELAPLVSWAASIAGAITTVGALSVLPPMGGRHGPRTSPPPAARPSPGHFATRI